MDGLTPAQRLHFDVYGYVVLESVLSPAEVGAMREALLRLKADPERKAKGVYSHGPGDHHLLMGNLVSYDPALLAYAVHPKLIPLVEDVVGGAVRLEESEAIVNRRDPARPVTDPTAVVPTGFHTGTRHGWGTYEEAGRFHCLFVKTLAYLNDIGPSDGGTAVIPGSHRLSWRQQEMIDAAMADPAHLVRQVHAPAGSVLLFAESLIHSTTAIFSEIERVILVSGYTPTMLREWPGNEPDPAFLATLPDDIRPIISGEQSWHWKRRYGN